MHERASSHGVSRVKIDVRYFASLREAAGMPAETVDTAAADVLSLYAELQARHGFTLPAERLRAAIDGAFARWDAPLHDGAEVAFLPPVSGG